MKKAERELRKDRELEIDSMVEWIRAGGKEKIYTEFVVSDKLAKRFPEDLDTLPRGPVHPRRQEPDGRQRARTSSTMRCYRCHKEGGRLRG